MRRGVRPRGMALASVALAIPLWVASTRAARGRRTGPVGQRTGPTHPDADAVGDAMSQILPLDQYHLEPHGVDHPALPHSGRPCPGQSNGADKTAKTGLKKADTS